MSRGRLGGREDEARSFGREDGRHRAIVASRPPYKYLRGMITPVRSRHDVVERLTSVEAQILDLGVRRLAVFGSISRDSPHPESDVDFLVEFQAGEKSIDRFMTLAELLETVLARRVDLVTTEGLSPYIGPYILAEAEDVVRAA